MDVIVHAQEHDLGSAAIDDFHVVLDAAATNDLVIGLLEHRQLFVRVHDVGLEVILLAHVVLLLLHLRGNTGGQQCQPPASH